MISFRRTSARPQHKHAQHWTSHIAVVLRVEPVVSGMCSYTNSWDLKKGWRPVASGCGHGKKNETQMEIYKIPGLPCSQAKIMGEKKTSGNKFLHTLSSLGSQDLFWLGCPLSNVHAAGLEAQGLPETPDSMLTPGLSPNYE